MRVSRRRAGADVLWVLGDVDPRHEPAVLDLAFEARDDEYVRAFPAGADYLEQAWPNFERHAEEMVFQAAREQAVPWREALRAFLGRVEGEGIDWWLAGSAALAVRGVDVEPRDFDVVVDATGAHRLAELLSDSVVEPLVPVTGWFCRWWSRAFLLARFEWVGDVGAAADVPEPTDFGPTAAVRLETVRWETFEVRLPPLDLQLSVTERRGLAARAAAIRAVL